MLTQKKLQGDQQATALFSDFEEFLRKQTDVRDLLAMRKGMWDKSNYDVLIEFFC